MKVLVFGRRGQVARALANSACEFELSFAGSDVLDLASADPDIAGLVAERKPDAVINAAAYTNVDRAETEIEACMRLNRDAPARMARVCAEADIPLAHFSTDYVFDGEKGSTYVEDDARNPLNVYGRSKAEGEAAIESIWAGGARVAVIRSSWVFSPGGPGFLQTMLRLARERDEVGVVADQWGCPTSAATCAGAALALVRQLLDRDAGAKGLFHAVGADAITWADFSEAIFAASAARGGPAVPVRRIATSDYKTAAVRPKDTRLSSVKLQAATDWRPPPLAEALAECFDQMELA
jgi:dTDP-4-dehydrorhamnose reductase